MGTKVAASLLVCLLLPSACVGWFDRGQPPYKDANLPVDVRVDDLLSRMTLEEKVAQLLCNWPQAADPEHIGKGIIDDAGCFNPEGARKVLAHGIGQIARPSEAKDVAATVRFINRIQSTGSSTSCWRRPAWGFRRCSTRRGCTATWPGVRPAFPRRLRCRVPGIPTSSSGYLQR
jgi:hypothetical protein